MLCRVHTRARSRLVQVMPMMGAGSRCRWNNQFAIGSQYTACMRSPGALPNYYILLPGAIALRITAPISFTCEPAKIVIVMFVSPPPLACKPNKSGHPQCTCEGRCRNDLALLEGNDVRAHLGDDAHACIQDAEHCALSRASACSETSAEMETCVKAANVGSIEARQVLV